MEKLITYVGDGIGWQSLAVIICLLVTGLPSFIKGFDYLVDRFGIETKGMRKRKAQEQKCTVQAAAIKSLEEKIAAYDSDNHDHWKVSVDYREKYAQDQEKIMEALSSLTDKIDGLQKKMDENELRKQIDGLRSTIIGFATSLSNLQFKPSEDHYNSIFVKIKNYEDILEEHGLENGQCSISIKIIEKHYSEAMERGDFLKVDA